jgi:hypothetical protein
LEVWIMKVAQAQEIPTQLGQAYGGGYFGGYYSLNADGVATHALIVAPVSARSVQPIIVSGAPASNSTSDYDGVFNTNAMIAAGAADYPAANYCTSYTGGGFTDWYIPSRHEWHACIRAIRNQSGETNNTWNNPYACPQLIQSNYAIGRTKQPFFSIGANDYGNFGYWTSTEVPGFRGGASTSTYTFTAYDGKPVASAAKTSSFFVLLHHF